MNGGRAQMAAGGSGRRDVQACQHGASHCERTGRFKRWRQQFTSVNGMGWVLALTLGSVFVAPMGFDVLCAFALLLAMLNRSGTANDVRRLARDPLLWCVATLLLYLAVSVFFSPQANWVNVSQVWMRIIFIVLFCLAVAIAIRELPGFEFRVCRVVTLSALAFAIIALAWFYLAPPAAPERLSGLFRFNNAGRAGRILCVVLLFILYALMTDRGRWRIAAICALPVVASALLLTDTRSAWLAGGLGLLVYGLAALRQSPLRFVALLVLCCAAGGALLGVWIASSADATAAVFPRGDSFRPGIWSAHLRDIYAGNPWYGLGQLNDHWVVVEGVRFRSAHNMYITVLGHIGIPGLLLFCTVLVWVGIRLLPRLELSSARLGLSLLIAGATMFIFSGDRLVDKVGVVWFVLWLPVGIALAVGVPASQSNRPTGGCADRTRSGAARHHPEAVTVRS